MRHRIQILEELNQLSCNADFIKVLVKLVSKNLDSKIEDLRTRNQRDILNINEITFLFGLWLKNKGKNQPGLINIEVVASEVHRLMDELHYTFLSMMPKIDKEKSFGDFMIEGNSLHETIIYSGPSVYDYQYATFFSKKYRLDNQWLKKNKGFSINSVLPFFNFFKELYNFKLNVLRYENVLDQYKYHKESFIFKKYPEFKRILEQISIKSDSEVNVYFENFGDSNIFEFRPVIEYHDYFFIPITYLVAQALYESPFYWFLEDSNYKSVALQNRGLCAEEITYLELLKIFNPESVLKNVFIKSNKTKTITELDVCVKDGHTLIIFQVKSKRLTQLSKRGNIEQIIKDYENAVESAQKQATLAYRPILDGICVIVDTNNKELFKPQEIKEIYTVCVVLDNYPPITSHAFIFNFENDNTPMAISIFDLNLIVEFLQTPERFIDYIKRRHIFSKNYISESELSYLSFYLHNGLIGTEPGEIRMIDSAFGQYFDTEYYVDQVNFFSKRLPSFVSDIKRNDKCFCGSGKKFKQCCKLL